MKVFKYVAMLAAASTVAFLSASNLKELAEIVKRGQMQYASYGTGSTAHFCGEAINKYAKVEMQHVPFQDGTADIHRDHFRTHESGKVKALASCLSKSSSLPDVLTFKESGIATSSAASAGSFMRRRGRPGPLRSDGLRL